MALKKNLLLVDNYDIQVNLGDSYIRVERVDATKATATANVSFMSMDKAKTYKIDLIDFVPDMDGGNFIAQAYLHLKTLPEFADAEDC